MFVVVVGTQFIYILMRQCEDSRSGGPFDVGGCACPVDIATFVDITIDQLTSAMAHDQPAVWTDPGRYCGSAELNCDDPVCIALPR